MAKDERSVVADHASESQIVPVAIADFELPHAVIVVGDWLRYRYAICQVFVEKFVDSITSIDGQPTGVRRLVSFAIPCHKTKE